MAKTKISEFDVDPSNNTDINSINIAEGCAPSGINNAIRQLMSDLKEQQTGASGDNFTVGGNLAVTGTSVFTGATTFTGAVVFSSTVGGLTNITLDTPTINSPTIIFEGATENDFETTLAVVDPTADRTITFPDKTGTVAMTSDMPSNTSLTSGSGTYSIAGTTMTISDASHGLTSGFQIYCNFTSGTATDNYFTVTVTDANTFTIAYGSSLTTSGNLTWYYSPKGLVSISSGDEVIAGTSTDRAVTPSGFQSAITNKFNLTGSAPVYGVRAWVNFDCTKNSDGTSNTDNTNRYLVGNGNIASVLKNSSGNYTVTFTTEMPDANYAINSTLGSGAASASDNASLNIVSISTTGFNFTISDATTNVYQNPPIAMVSVVR